MQPAFSLQQACASRAPLFLPFPCTPPTQIDLFDLCAEGHDEYRYVLVYIDHFTKHVWLRPLKTKNSSEIASHVSAALMTSSDSASRTVLPSVGGRGAAPAGTSGHMRCASWASAACGTTLRCHPACSRPAPLPLEDSLSF